MISFGTDGWRGIISDAFTFENVRLVSQSLADMINEDAKLPKKIAIGFDRRFLSKEFAEETAKVMAANGIMVLLAEDFIPTPIVSWSAKNIAGLAGGVVITASHNPSFYNGYKFKENLGCSASSETTKKIERHISSNQKSGSKPKILESVDEGFKKGSIKTFNPIDDYTNSLSNVINCKALKNLKGKILIDPMHGAGSLHLVKILKKFGIEAFEINSSRDPLFGGVNPEPIEINLAKTIGICKKEKPLLCIVLDGDSDRIGAIDENGEFFGPQQIFTLITWYCLSKLGKTGTIAKTVSTTHAIDELAKKYGAKIVETPIGFKYIAQKMVDGEIFLGGEESGGIGFSDHLPERDAILASLYILSAIESEGKGTRAIYKNICKDIDLRDYSRKDFHISDTGRDEINSALKKNPPSKVAGKRVIKKSDYDGFKFILEDKSWVLIRASGTEAVLRIYAEAKNREETSLLIEEALRILPKKSLNF